MMLGLKNSTETERKREKICNLGGALAHQEPWRPKSRGGNLLPSSGEDQGRRRIVPFLPLSVGGT
jgi:hypothetical protein